MCTQGHEECKFTVRWARDGITKVRDTCEACWGSGLKTQRRRERKSQHRPALEVRLPARQPLGVKNGREHRFLPPPQRHQDVITFGDLEVAKRFSWYEEADGNSAKNQVAEEISMETYVSLKRVKELCQTVLPTRKRKLVQPKKKSKKNK